MIILNIIWPVLAMVAVIFVVWFTLVRQRLGHIKRNPPTAETFATNDAAGRYFAPVAMSANNLANLFEMPVLFFALIPLLVFAQQATAAQVVLAWIFVVLRAAHSFIHIGPKKVPARFMVYLASCAVLLAMWLGFGIDMVTAAHRYDEAMRGLVRP